MTRSEALFCAAAVAIGAAVGVSYMAFPAQGGAEELSVAEPPAAARSARARPTESLHQVREQRERPGRIASPFLPEHPTRGDGKPPTPATPQTPPTKRTERPGPDAPQEIRLVGVVSAETGRRAIVAVGKKQLLLRIGEEKDGVTLETLTETEATISTAAGERKLALPSGLSR